MVPYRKVPMMHGATPTTVSAATTPATSVPFAATATANQVCPLLMAFFHGVGGARSWHTSRVGPGAFCQGSRRDGDSEGADQTQLGQGLFVLMLPLRPLDRSGNAPPTGVLGAVVDHSQGHPPGRGEVRWVPQTFLHPPSLFMSLEERPVCPAIACTP